MSEFLYRAWAVSIVAFAVLALFFAKMHSPSKLETLVGIGFLCAYCLVAAFVSLYLRLDKQKKGGGFWANLTGAIVWAGYGYLVLHFPSQG